MGHVWCSDTAVRISRLRFFNLEFNSRARLPTGIGLIQHGRKHRGEERVSFLSEAETDALSVNRMIIHVIGKQINST